MCAHTTWNPLTINPMGFPLTTVYNNTLLGKNNSKDKHMIISLQHTETTIYIYKMPLKVRQFSPLGTSSAAECLWGSLPLALGFWGQLPGGTLLSASFQRRRSGGKRRGWGHPARSGSSATSSCQLPVNLSSHRVCWSWLEWASKASDLASKTPGVWCWSCGRQ